MIGVRPVVSKSLLIEKNAWIELHRHAREAGVRREIGGILLGFRRGDHLHVTAITKPGPSDQSSRFRFFRRDWSHQATAVRQWLASGFQIDWLGEWHTHPERHPRPSIVDVQTWCGQSNRRQTSMAYIIIGLDGSWVGRMDMGQTSPSQMVKSVEDEEYVVFWMQDC